MLKPTKDFCPKIYIVPCRLTKNLSLTVIMRGSRGKAQQYGGEHTSLYKKEI